MTQRIEYVDWMKRNALTDRLPPAIVSRLASLSSEELTYVSHRLSLASCKAKRAGHPLPLSRKQASIELSLTRILNGAWKRK